MARNVTYSVAPRINPRDKEAAPKYYGRVQANGDVNIREMSERIQQTCTVHKADVQAVLLALEDVIADAFIDAILLFAKIAIILVVWGIVLLLIALARKIRRVN